MTNFADARSARTISQFIRPALLEAGQLALALRSELGKPEIKSDGSPVCKADYEIEALLVGLIRSKFPSHRILAEEGSVGGDDSDYMWAVDPLDGTRAYISGLPIWGISIGLLQGEQPLVGAFFMPAINELYESDGQSATLNGRLLPTSVVSLDPRSAFLAVPSNSHLEYDIDFKRLRSLGSTAAHLAFVARGAAVGALTRRVRIWDLAGMLPILPFTGIELRYLSGAPLRVNELLDGRKSSEPLLAAPAQHVNYLLSVIRPKPSSTHDHPSTFTSIRTGNE